MKTADVSDARSLLQPKLSNLNDTRIIRLEVASSRKKHNNPNSQYVQKLKARIENEDRLESLHKQKKYKNKSGSSFVKAAFNEERVDILGHPLDKNDVDMKDVIRKALMMRLGKPQDHVYI